MDTNESTEMQIFHEIPTHASMHDIVELAKQNGIDAFRGVRIHVDGNIQIEQLDALTEALDSEVTLVKLQVGTRIIAVGNEREYAPGLTSFNDRGNVEIHLHTHVPEEVGKPETLKKGPSTTDMRFSEGTATPLYLRTSGKIYEYKMPEFNEGRILNELQGEFFGNPTDVLRTAIDDPSSEVHGNFWKIIDEMKEDRNDNVRIAQLKDRYAEEQASEMIFRRILMATNEEEVELTSFIVERMSNPEWQASHSGAYVREVSTEDFDRLFNPPTIYVSSKKSD